MTTFLNRGWARGLSLVAAFVLMLLVTLAPRALTVEDGRAIGHGALTLIMWGMSAGFVHGVGFVPNNAVLRILLGPWVAWPLMALGLSYFARPFL
ncbi:MAG: cyd operon YbgE family protein [Thiobacillus sp.]